MCAFETYFGFHCSICEKCKSLQYVIHFTTTEYYNAKFTKFTKISRIQQLTNKEKLNFRTLHGMKFRGIRLYTTGGKTD